VRAHVRPVDALIHDRIMAYTNTQAHLLDELRRIDAILDIYKETQQAGRTDERPAIKPQTVVDEPSRVPLALPEASREKVATLTDQIEEQCHQTESATLRLRVLAESFDFFDRLANCAETAGYGSQRVYSLFDYQTKVTAL